MTESATNPRYAAAKAAAMPPAPITANETWRLIYDEEWNQPAESYIFSNTANRGTWYVDPAKQPSVAAMQTILTPDAVHVDPTNGGTLIITATPGTVINNQRQYWTAYLDTEARFAFQYGYAEARLKIPAGSGLWPAFWLKRVAQLGQYCWPPEVNILEAITEDSVHLTIPNLRYLTEQPLSYSSASPQPCFADTSVLPSRFQGETQYDFPRVQQALVAGDWHRIGLDWQPSQLVWYLDGTPFYTITRHVPNVPMYMLLSLDISKPGRAFGAEVGPDNPSPPSGTLEVDYVKVWQRAQSPNVTDSLDASTYYITPPRSYDPTQMPDLSQTRVHDFKNLENVPSSEPAIGIEDGGRLRIANAADTEAYATWASDRDIADFRAATYWPPQENGSAGFTFQTSANGVAWANAPAITATQRPGQQPNANWQVVSYKVAPPAGTRLVRVAFPTAHSTGSAPQLGLVRFSSEPIKTWKIMPMGDSLTEGGGPDNPNQSYRGHLFNKLALHALLNGYEVDFVGSQQRATLAGGDVDHEGHSGFTIGPDYPWMCMAGDLFRGIASSTPNNWLSIEHDVILLLIGTNDFAADFAECAPGYSVGANDRLRNLIATLWSQKPNTTVLLSTLLPPNPGLGLPVNPGKTSFNNTVRDLANNIYPGRIILVDNDAQLRQMGWTSDDFTDGVHTTDQGAQKTANVWLGVLTQTLETLASNNPAPPARQITFGNADVPWAISALTTTRIAAANFDQGGEGLAYHDSTAANEFGIVSYRPAEKADTSWSVEEGGGPYLSWIAEGEWTEYTIQVQQAGTYTLRLRAANGAAEAGLRVLFGPKEAPTDKTGRISIRNTGGWGQWQTFEKTDIALNAGPQIMRVQFEGGMNLNWLELTQIAPTPKPSSFRLYLPIITHGA